LTLGYTVEKLLSVLTLDEWFAWQAYEQLEPWGETRADLRQAAAAAYQLAPYLPADFALPKLTYPYFAAAEEIDVATITATVREHDRMWTDWDRQRRSGRVSGSALAAGDGPGQHTPAASADPLTEAPHG
jgi:hypothetical protein